MSLSSGYMEENREAREERVRRAGQAVKWAFAIFLAVSAGLIAVLHLFRTHPAQDVLMKAVERVQEGDLEGAMEYVDPQGPLGIMWRDNVGGTRDALVTLADRYRLQFESVKFKVRTEGEYAEAALAGGRVTLYQRGGEGPLLAFFDLKDTGLVFYLQKKDGSWLIEGINYDLQEILSGNLEWIYNAE